MNSPANLLSPISPDCRPRVPAASALAGMGIPRKAKAYCLREVTSWLLLACLLSLSLVFAQTNLDVIVARWFWSDTGGWHLANTTWVQWLYRFGSWPALLVGIGGLLIALGSRWFRRLHPLRRSGLFLALALLLGPGLIVNGVLKKVYFRPRPVQVAEFGGGESFQALGEPTLRHTGHSFPSGHAAMGFYWLAPALFLCPRRRKLAVAFLALALVHGGLMGFGRMAQGGHWFSDVLWSAGIVWLTALAVLAVLPDPPAARPQDKTAPAQLPRLDAADPQVAHPAPIPKLTIVVPFYNESANATFVLGELRGVLPAAEIIAVDDGSTDDTWEQIRNVPGIRSLRLPRNLGQSAAMYYGLRAATGELCGLMDGDGQNDPANFLPLLQAWLRGEAEVICGYRLGRQDTWSRRVASRLANGIRRRFLDDGVRDTGCSQKIFPRSAVELLVPFRGMHRYLPAIFKQAGLRLAEVPVRHRQRRAGLSKYSNWTRALDGIHDLIGVSWLLKHKLPPNLPSKISLPQP
jgi:dolichol-phosphate mannosyltransferase